MAKAVGNLFVRLGLDSSRFAAGLKSAGTSTKSFASKLRQSTKMVGAFGLAMTTAAAVGVTAIVKNTLSAVDTLAKTSNKLGVTTERLSGLRYAAEQTGISVQTMDMALQRMVRRVAEAAQGTGEAKAALKELGVSARRLNDLSPDEQFLRIAAAMSGVKTQADRVRLGFKLFDSEGVALVNTLAIGEKGLRAMFQELRDLGGEVSSFDAARIEDANDAFNDMKKVMEGAAITLTSELAPLIEGISNRLIKASKDAGGFRNEIISGMEAVAVAVTSVTYLIDRMAAGFKFIGKVSPNLFKMYGQMMDPAKRAAVGKDISDMFDAKPMTPDRVRKFFANVRAEADKAGKTGGEPGAGAGAGARTINLKGIEDAVKAQKKIADEAASIYKSIQTPAENHVATVKRLREMYEMGAITFDTWKTSVAQSTTALNAHNEGLKRQAEAQKIADEQVRKSTPAYKQWEKDVESAKSIIEEFRTPMEKYESSIGNLDSLLRQGMISWEIYGKAVRQARKELEGVASATMFLQGKRSRMAFGDPTSKGKPKKIELQEQFQKDKQALLDARMSGQINRAEFDRRLAVTEQRARAVAGLPQGAGVAGAGNAVASRVEKQGVDIGKGDQEQTKLLKQIAANTGGSVVV